MAVKIVSKFQAPGEHLTKFLPREIEVVKGLKHPHLIRFLQAIETTHRSVCSEQLRVDWSSDDESAIRMRTDLFENNIDKNLLRIELSWILVNFKSPFCRVYIIMEYAQNGSLLDVIRRDTYIDEQRSRRWFRQLLEAIDYCHDRGIVHR